MVRMKKIRVLIAEDHTIVRQGLSALLRSESDIEVVGEASDGLEATEMAKKMIPDVVLMDIAMRNLNGLDATRTIKKLFPSMKVLVLTMYDNEEIIFQILLYNQILSNQQLERCMNKKEIQNYFRYLSILSM